MGHNKGHTTIRNRAVKRYYEDPAVCKHCGKTIPVRDGTRPSETKSKKFCDRSCAAKYNNIGRNRHKGGPTDRGDTTCPDCGGKKWCKAVVCQRCKVGRSMEKVLSSTISRYTLTNGNARIKYASIREWARRYLELLEREKKCAICDFDTVVEVCHIKPISQFKETDLMGDVNHKDNLVYLCPNHHAMLDKGLLKL